MSTIKAFGLGALVLVALAAGLDAQLKIVVMDVGQGNGAVIQSPAGKIAVFDAGPTTTTGDNILSLIRDTLGQKHIQYTFVSHYHADHIGGLDEVINGLTRDSILGGCWDRGGSYASTAYTNYNTAAGSKRFTDTLGKVFDLGSGVTLRCVCMNGQVWTSGSVSVNDENTNSMGLLLTYGNFKMIFATDIGGQASGNYSNVEKLLAPVIGKVNVLLVNHHGSATSSNYAWVTALDPQVSIISCGGPTNSYGHPKQTAIDTLLMDPKLGGTKSRAGDSNYIYQTESTGTSYGVIPAGRGRAVNKNIWIRVFPSYYVVVGDIPRDTVMFSALAVELSQFTAQQGTGGIDLWWRTESERECYQWRIERSTDEDAGYVPIGTIAGYGTTDQPHDYSYADRSLTAPGRYWYRLAETDLSGNTAYHGPVEASYGAQGATALSAATVYPNPARGAASLRYQAAGPGTMEAAVYNIAGQRVKQLFNGAAAAGPAT
ncbi:MAG TPA: MBL fold metallo-hydrolase, partial [Candidatus Edwardsbacteria bacterium]|nr:MBL fold metallo-hydrolase [Candidatus Edwardsbacteria bacterium]